MPPSILCHLRFFDTFDSSTPSTRGRDEESSHPKAQSRKGPGITLTSCLPTFASWRLCVRFFLLRQEHARIFATFDIFDSSPIRLGIAVLPDSCNSCDSWLKKSSSSEQMTGPRHYQPPNSALLITKIVIIEVPASPKTPNMRSSRHMHQSSNACAPPVPNATTPA